MDFIWLLIPTNKKFYKDNTIREFEYWMGIIDPKEL